MRIDPTQTGSIGNVQDREAIQLQMVEVPRCSDPVGEWDWESIEGEALWLKRLCDGSDNLHRPSLRDGAKGMGI